MDERNQLLKRMNFAQTRIETYGYALRKKELNLLSQRIDSSSESLADVNDMIADLEEHAAASFSEAWMCNASKNLVDAAEKP